MGRQIYEALEMTPLEYYPYLYTTTDSGEKLEVVGGVADPWIVTATLETGPVGGKIIENVTAPFIDGFANFTGLLFSIKGAGYSVKFELTYPKEVTLNPVTSNKFEVGPRPLGLQLDAVSDQVQENEDVAVPFHIFDLGQKVKASPEVLKGLTWDCTLGWPINTPVQIDGKRTYAIDTAGNNTGEFMVKFKNSKVAVALEAECSAREELRKLTGRSNTFNVFPDRSGKIGLFSLQTTAIKYTGPFTFIKSVIDSVPATSLKECTGASCPSVVSSKRKRSIENADSKIIKPGLNLAMYQSNASPVCIRPDGNIHCA